MESGDTDAPPRPWARSRDGTASPLVAPRPRWPHLLPTLAAGPSRGLLVRASALLATAWVIAPPKRGDWAIVAKVGPALWTQPGEMAGGYPLDAVLALPLRPLVGPSAWEHAGLVLWMWVAGLSAAWLGGRWWGSVGASFVVGLAWQVIARAPVAAGGSAFALAALPFAWGWTVAALDRRSFLPIALAGLGVGALIAAPGAGVRWYALAVFPVGALAALEGRLFAVLSTALGASGVAVLASLPFLAWQAGGAAELDVTPVPSLPLLPAALWGAWLARSVARRTVAPTLLTVAGASSLALVSDAVQPVAGLGVSLLAGAAGTGWRARLSRSAAT